MAGEVDGCVCVWVEWLVADPIADPVAVNG